MATPVMVEPYIVPDSVQMVVQKERARIIQCMNEGHPDGSYKEAVEQYLAWQCQVKELEAFMSYFGISYY